MGASDENEHHGYEVEFITYGEVDGQAVKMAKKCDHPSGRDFAIDVTVGGSEAAPTLTVLDEADETIAAYNGGSWVAIRKNARPST